MTYLLDTCILSKLRKIRKHPNKSLEAWISKHNESKYFLSVITIGEIQHGISKLPQTKKKMIFEDWLRGEVIPRFEGRIKSIDLNVAKKWGDLKEKKGLSIPNADGLIAATALVYDLILVTENIKDFSTIDELKLFNP